jgi:hypothetical protein
MYRVDSSAQVLEIGVHRRFRKQSTKSWEGSYVGIRQAAYMPCLHVSVKVAESELTSQVVAANRQSRSSRRTSTLDTKSQSGFSCRRTSSGSAVGLNPSKDDGLIMYYENV